MDESASRVVSGTIEAVTAGYVIMSTAALYSSVAGMKSFNQQGNAEGGNEDKNDTNTNQQQVNTEGTTGDNGGTGTTRVGRWMSQEEYDKMISTRKVQMSADNKVHVANPADINAFSKQAPNGSLYVEFDVPSNTISKGGTDGWRIVNGPGSLLDRLYAKKGLPRITEIPNATNITIRGRK